jgi:hypothetical protein
VGDRVDVAAPVARARRGLLRADAELGQRARRSGIEATRVQPARGQRIGEPGLGPGLRRSGGAGTAVGELPVPRDRLGTGPGGWLVDLDALRLVRAQRRAELDLAAGQRLNNLHCG